MKQNKFRQKEVPHVKEEIPFELSNLNQKLEVSYIFLVSPCVLRWVFVVAVEGYLSLVYTMTCTAVVTNSIRNQLLIEYIFLVHLPFRHLVN